MVELYCDICEEIVSTSYNIALRYLIKVHENLARKLFETFFTEGHQFSENKHQQRVNIRA